MQTSLLVLALALPSSPEDAAATGSATTAATTAPATADAAATETAPGTTAPAAAAPAPSAATSTTPLVAPATAPAPSFFAPVPMDQRRPLVTDRPDLTESPITVDAGHIQIETDLVVATLRDGANATPLSFDLMPSNVKVGLTPSVDLQVLVPALGVVVDGLGQVAPAAGDLGVRLKWNLLGNDGEGVGVAVMPWAFVGGGDLRPGAGVIVPVSIPLPADFGLGTMVVANYVPVDGGSYDAEVIATASVGHGIVGDLAGYLEIFGAGRPLTRSGEVLGSTGVTWLVNDSLQLDAGLRLPLVTDDPRVETFLGVSARH